MLSRCSAIVVLLGLAAACGPGERGESAPEEAATIPADTVVLETTVGRIVIALENEKAPRSVENFLLHVRSKFYDGLVFHRIEPGFVVQTGEVNAQGGKRSSTVFPIESEADNGLKNLRGTVAMARTADPHSATSQFFINLTDNAKLDFTEKTATGWGYTVFGKVVDGMDALDSIARIPTTVRGRSYRHFPTDPPVITRAYIATRSN